MEEHGDAVGADGRPDQGPQDQQSQDQRPQDQQSQEQRLQDQPHMQAQMVQPMFVPYLPQPPKRSKAPLIFTGAGCLVLGILIGYGAGHGSKTATDSATVITTTTAPSTAAAANGAGANPASPANPSSAAAAHTTASSSAAPAAPAKIGGTISLTGMHGDEKLAVTLVKVADPAKSSEEYSGPSDGKRWVAVQIRVTNTGTAAYADSPGNGAKLVDTQSQRYSETFGNTTLGQAMDTDVKLAPGDSALGVILFEVPADQKLATFQFALDSGFADQTGQWQMS